MELRPKTESTRSARLLDELRDEVGRPIPDARVVVSPYRICPIGAHSDHQGGPTLGMAVTAHTLLAFTPTETSTVRLDSTRFDPPVELALDAAGEITGWGRYPRAAALALRDRLPSTARGFVGRIDGTLPGSGLSSSASVLLAYLSALAHVNDVALSESELVRLSLEAERTHVGVSVGILDPAAIAGSKRGKLLAIDCRAHSWEPLPLGADAPDYRVLVAFSGVPRNLTATPFNDRVAECFRAAERLASLSGRGRAAGLHDLPDEVYEAHGHELPAGEARRARHFFTERRRVREGTACWTRGDLAGLGALMRASCESSIHNWETGSPELIAIQGLLASTPGVFGSRFSGAGFGGSVVALVEAAQAEAARAHVDSEIRQQLPELAERAGVLLADSDDGLRVEAP